jgi:hypothetical protein
MPQTESTSALPRWANGFSAMVSASWKRFRERCVKIEISKDQSPYLCPHCSTHGGMLIKGRLANYGTDGWTGQAYMQCSDRMCGKAYLWSGKVRNGR